MAFPIPDEAPVTSAIFPLSLVTSVSMAVVPFKWRSVAAQPRVPILIAIVIIDIDDGRRTASGFSKVRRASFASGASRGQALTR